ncbi:MAG: penicillin-binding protein 2 [Thermodesulfobacteriota bacterium]|nr:MAG: penicillin-binding protein 2 [Thermodesulfobacteriota bacterium]
MQDFRNRLLIVTVILGLAFLVLGSRLWYLQVLKGDEFAKFSMENHIRVERIPAPRGRILDRYGKELVINRTSFDIYVIPKDVKDIPYLSSSLSQVLNLDSNQIEKDIKSALSKKSFKPVLITKDINRDQLAYIEARRSSLLGVIIEINNLRQYPHGVLGASFLGYIGKVNDAELQNNPNINNTDLVGKTGVEKGWESSLRGDHGYKQKVTDALGREVESNLFLADLHNKKSMPGNDVRLTIDISLQQAAEEVLGEESGAIVVVDVNSGQVLALASKPSFDPADFIKGIDSKTWANLVNDKSSPLLNRATQGLYAPGSVFKMVPSVAALNEGFINEEEHVYCPGYYKSGSSTFRCWKRGGHGRVNLRSAIVKSCDVYFYKIAEMMGINNLNKYMTAFGYGSKTDLGIEERAGVAPSREWKKKRFNKSWYKGETILSSIGQGYVSVTPLQVAMMTAAVANDGKLLKPSIIKEIVSYGGEEKFNHTPTVTSNIPVQKQMLDLVKDAMVGVVNDPGGTGRSARLQDMMVAGKTGTAQVVSLDSQSEKRKHRDHAWFTSYAPAESPEIAVTVLIEHGGKGGAVAAPIAKKILEVYKKLKEEREADDNV